MRTDKEARQQVFEITQELFAMGQLTPTGGNVSSRAADDDKLWITPSQMFKGGLRVEDIVCIDRNGELVEGSSKCSVEFQMHWACYDAREGTTSAVHTHAPYVTAFGITNQTFPPINTDAIFLA